MASVKDFCSQLENLDAVDTYLLIAADGRLVAHTLLDSDQLSSLITLTMLAAEKIENYATTGRLQSLALGLSEDRTLVLFALGKWILAVQQQSHATHNDLSKQVKAVINNFRNS